MADAKLTALSETSVPALPDPVYSVDVSDTTDDAAGSSRSLTLSRLLGLLNHVCRGRLTLTSGTPVTTSDVTGATSVYFTPYNGDLVSVWDGTRWKLYQFTELTLALGTLTSGANYDIFLYDNSGTLTLKLGPAWSGDTARGTGAGTTELDTQDGVHVNKVAISGGPGAKAGRYLGTIRTTSTTTTEDSGGGTTTQVGGKRFVWNAQNRLPRTLCVIDTTDNWTYGTNAWRQADAAAGNKVEYVCGLLIDPAEATVTGNGFGSGIAGAVGVGVDSTSANSAKVFGQLTSSSNAPLTTYRGWPGIGYHYLAWLEITRAGTITFQGDDGVTNLQSGLQATVMA